MAKGQKPIEVSPGEFIVGSGKGDDNADDLPDEAQVVSVWRIAHPEH